MVATGGGGVRLKVVQVVGKKALAAASSCTATRSSRGIGWGLTPRGEGLSGDGHSLIGPRRAVPRGLRLFSVEEMT